MDRVTALEIKATNNGVHTHKWKPMHTDWNYEIRPMPSYTVVCSCGASALAIETKVKEIINIRELQK
jgi:hypothetical protein